MRVVQQLIDHFRYTKGMTPELEARLVELGLIEQEKDGYECDGYCEECGEWALGDDCLCSWHNQQPRFAELYEDDFEARWRSEDADRRRKVSRRLRGKRGRRREATIRDVRLALARQFDKWLLPGARLDRLIEVGSVLAPCTTWQKAAHALMSLPVDRLVEELGRHERYSVRPLFNRLHDFDLVLQSFARPWRGRAGAALRRLVDGRHDKRCRRILKYEEFRCATQLVELAGHLKQARKLCLRRSRSRTARQSSQTA